MIAGALAQFLQFLCEMSDRFVHSTIVSRFTSSLISVSALDSAAIENEVKSLTNSVIQSAPEFLLKLLLLNYVISGNQYISALGTNAVAYTPRYIRNMASLSLNYYEMVDGSKCYCLPVASCSAPAAVYSDGIGQTLNSNPSNVNSTIVKGMRIGCYPFNGALSSTLECYFDSDYLHLLVSNLTQFQVLNASRPSRYPRTATVQDMASLLLIEGFSFQYSKESYYAQCAPFACTYQNTERSTVIGILTSAIGLVAGLNTLLRLIIPSFITLVVELKRRIKRSMSKSIAFVQVAPGNQF